MNDTIALIPSEKLHNIDQIRETVIALQAVPCGLAHEAVAFDGHVAVRRSQGVGFDPVLVRCGLCPIQKRAFQLSCAHTTARLKLERAVDAMVRHAVLDPEDAEEIKGTLQETSIEIYSIDEALNKAESEYALLVERNTIAECSDDRKILGYEENIQHLKMRHRHIVARLDAVSIDLICRFK